MINSNGRFLNETLNSLALDKAEKSITITSAKSLLEKIIKCINTDQKKRSSNKSSKRVGLVYGKIQSGKTRAMIACSAMSFDNGFKIVVVLTSNINDLVSQTYEDFVRQLNGVSVFSKDDDLPNLVVNAQLDLENPDGRILMIASKGAKSLRHIVEFLNKIDVSSESVLIFDDEGDQASLDTQTFKRSKTGNLSLKPSIINDLILKLRSTSATSVYVSVTGTPQAVLLQSADSSNRPSFIHVLSAGESYVGGDIFFDTDEPEDNALKLISTIPANDLRFLLSAKRPIPDGLKKAIIFFLISGSYALSKPGYRDSLRDKEKGFQFLCHPSLKTTEQKTASNRIQLFLTEIKKVLLGYPNTESIEETFQEQYGKFKLSFDKKEVIDFSNLKKIIAQELLRLKILVINTKTKRQGIAYGSGLNFLIGGNTLGRGIAIPNLLVTYYVRSNKISQIDTMYQHARMFGYRRNTLPFTRLFITKKLYYRFRDIHFSDKGLREFIETHASTYPDSFPVEVATNLRATRKSVLDIKSTDTIWPGRQLYPNAIAIPQSSTIYDAVLTLIKAAFGDMNNLETIGKSGVKIDSQLAIKIVSLIKTEGKNSWQDKTIKVVLDKLTQRLGNEIMLKFRFAIRNMQVDGELESGTLSGDEQAQARLEKIPTLWIMSVTSSHDAGRKKIRFVYPTIVVPNSLPEVFIYSKK